MTNDLQDTWNTIATMWNRWAPPLRPSAEDITIMENAVSTWQQGKSFDGYGQDGYVQAVLLGVTPEIATMNFFIPTNLLAIDISPDMIKYVWPGDVLHQRQAVEGDWLTYTIKPGSKNMVLADGSLVFFSPDKMDQILTKITQSLSSDGIFIARCFVMPSTPESFATVMREAQNGNISNFHEFKFRLAMSLQNGFSGGVSQGSIWRSIQTVLKVAPNNEYSNDDLSTGDLYKNKSSKHHYPTVAELTDLLNTHFSSVQVITPTYQFGQCCPTFIAQGPRQ